MESIEPKETRLLLADDHRMILEGIRDMLAPEPYCVAAVAADGREALGLIEADPGRFDILVTDISMPLLSGIELCRRVKTTYPHIAVLVLSMYSSATAIEEAVMAEADGYLLKNAGKDELLRALHRLRDGGTYFSESILPIIHRQHRAAQRKDEARNLLSAREVEILSLIVQERTSDQIARQLSISKKTVDNHRANILEKTGCGSTVGLVKWAFRAGFA